MSKRNGSGKEFHSVGSNGHNSEEAAMIMIAVRQEASVRSNEGKVIAREIEITEEAVCRKINEVIELCGIHGDQITMEIIKDKNGNGFAVLLTNFPNRQVDQFLDVLSEGRMVFECNHSNPYDDGKRRDLLIRPFRLYE